MPKQPDNFSTTAYYRGDAFAVVELGLSGLHAPLTAVPSSYGAVVHISFDDQGPLAYPRADVEQAAKFAVCICLIPVGDGYIGGQAVTGYGHDWYTKQFAPDLEVLLREGGRALVVTTNPSMLGEWETLLHYLAPHAYFHVYRPTAAAAPPNRTTHVRSGSPWASNMRH